MATELRGSWGGRARNLLGMAVDGLIASRWRSLTIIASVALSLFWVVSGLAISQGLKGQAQVALQGAGDLFVSADVFGADAPLKGDLANDLRRLPGVRRVTPRIIGRLRVGNAWASVVSRLVEDPSDLASNDLPPSGKVLVGSALAKRSGWKVGKRVLLEAQTSAVFEVAGLFDAGAGVGSAHTIVMEWSDIQRLFQRTEFVSDFVVDCEPGRAARLAESIAADRSLRVQTKDLVEQYLDRAYTRRAGVLLLVFAGVFAIAVPLFLLLAELGVSPRRRELGVLKACGWTTGDVLVLTLLENALLAVLGAASAVAVAWVWVRVFDAFWIRGFFIPGSTGTEGALTVPSEFSGMPVLVGGLLAVLLTTTAGLLSVWRSSTVPPAVAMQS